MRYDDDDNSLEADIARAQVSGNIVRVDFARASRARRSRDTGYVINTGEPAPTYQFSGKLPGMPWIRDLDLQAPWVLRMLAVVLVLILSMLIL